MRGHTNGILDLAFDEKGTQLGTTTKATSIILCTDSDTRSHQGPPPVAQPASAMLPSTRLLPLPACLYPRSCSPRRSFVLLGHDHQAVEHGVAHLRQDPQRCPPSFHFGPRSLLLRRPPHHQPCPPQATSTPCPPLRLSTTRAWSLHRTTRPSACGTSPPALSPTRSRCSVLVCLAVRPRPLRRLSNTFYRHFPLSGPRRLGPRFGAEPGWSSAGQRFQRQGVRRPVTRDALGQRHAGGSRDPWRCFKSQPYLPQTVRIWQVAGGSCKHILTDHEHVVEAVAFAPAATTKYANAAIFGAVRQRRALLHSLCIPCCRA